MVSQTKVLNQMQVPTWGWLKINRVEFPAAFKRRAYTYDPLVQRVDPVVLDDILPELDMQPVAGMEEIMQLWTNHTLVIHIPQGAKVEQPVYLDYRMDGSNSQLFNRLHIAAGEGSQASVVIRYTAVQGEQSVHGGYITLDVQPSANVDCTIVQMLPDDAVHAQAVQAKVSTQGVLNLLVSELGSANAVSSVDVHLQGSDASAQLDSMYTAGGSARRDMNYRIGFVGERTQGEIVARGVLGDSAHKVLRSTVDFIRGASGASGREEESVLVLSDRVINKSVPLLLCGEDDVEGQHATNIGRPDAEKLYYLMSRGLKEKDARRLLVEASLSPMLDKVQLPELRQEMTVAIQKVVDKDG